MGCRSEDSLARWLMGRVPRPDNLNFDWSQKMKIVCLSYSFEFLKSYHVNCLDTFEIANVIGAWGALPSGVYISELLPFARLECR